MTNFQECDKNVIHMGMCRLHDELHRHGGVPAAKLSGAQQVLSQLAHAAAAVDTFPGLYTVFCK
jgi:hypothetical protein